MKECYRCGFYHDDGHPYYCNDCLAKMRKETPEEKARWRVINKKLAKQRYCKTNPEKCSEARKRYMEKYPGNLWAGKVRNWKAAGIINPPETREEYDEMVLDLSGICPACRRPVSGKRAGGWQLHHDHKTGLVIGLVCQRCNMGMGQFEDNPDIMMNV